MDVTARYFVELTNVSDLHNLITNPLWHTERHFILGGGSNVLFTKDYPGIVVYNNIKGIEVVSDDATSITVRVAAAESWHDVVMWSVEQKLWGIENLALIPGTVGAAPVQNIGAYGVEVASSIHTVDVVDTTNGRAFTLTQSECQFGYRTSVFKTHPHYFVTGVTFVLSKIPQPQLSYDALSTAVESQNREVVTSRDVAEAVMEIRRSKLPEVGEIGMAGSFFKNPIIDRIHAQALTARYPNMRVFDVSPEQVKISAGWLIETLGYKGYREGQVGTYDKHALVLVNHANATGAEVWQFAQKIMDEVQETFGIQLEPEVLVV